MKSTKIDFQWTENQKEHHKLLERQKMYVVFNGLAEGYNGDNNEISKKMVKDIIPYADKIVIDKDFNNTQDEPVISYEVGKKKKLLKIKRYHKIVWTILDKYCEE